MVPRAPRLCQVCGGSRDACSDVLLCPPAAGCLPAFPSSCTRASLSVSRAGSNRGDGRRAAFQTSVTTSEGRQHTAQRQQHLPRANARTSRPPAVSFAWPLHCDRLSVVWRLQPGLHADWLFCEAKLKSEWPQLESLPAFDRLVETERRTSRLAPPRQASARHRARTPSSLTAAHPAYPQLEAQQRPAPPGPRPLTLLAHAPPPQHAHSAPLPPAQPLQPTNQPSLFTPPPLALPTLRPAGPALPAWPACHAPPRRPALLCGGGRPAVGVRGVWVESGRHGGLSREPAPCWACWACWASCAGAQHAAQAPTAARAAGPGR